MAGGIEAAGDLATGGLIARAVEPATGSAPPGPVHGRCLNCGTPLVGDYCHSCGQSAHVHRTLGSIGHDLLHGVFHFEGKVWRTIPMLVRHPGRLTRSYIDGQRARYVSPLALFLFAVFVMAAAFSWVGHPVGAPLVIGMSRTDRIELLHSIDQQIAQTQAAERELAAQPGAATSTPLRIQAGALATEVQALQAQRQSVITGHPSSDALRNVHTGTPWLDRLIGRVTENPGLLLYKIQASSYKFSWALIPISAPFVALLFLWGRRFPLYDHAIFVTYSLSFMSLLTAILRLPAAIGLPMAATTLLMAVVAPVHMFAQLRGTYGIGRLAAAWRTVLLLGFAVVALLAFGAAITLLEIYG